MENEMKERIVTVEVQVNSLQDEVTSLRHARHEHANIIQNHTGILYGLEISVNKLISSIDVWAKKTSDNTRQVQDFKVMAATAIVMGGGFIGFCVFVGGKILKWW